MGSLEQEFTEAFERYSDELFRHASMRLPNRERAMELTQECFMKVWQYAQNGHKVDAWRPFLYQTLRHLIIDEYRRKKSVSLEGMMREEDESTESMLPPDESNTLLAAMERLDGKQAIEMLRDLPYIYSEVLTLRFVESMSPGEIAQVVGESENVVSVRIHRGLKKLKEMLEKQ
ncbi:MAG: RNA polymerase sigma factor [Patescibacteria group bacterium]